MNANEKLSLIERVEHASKKQAKRTLKSMILKCNIKQETIARAIRDAIERHTPTPTIVYEQPESEHENESDQISIPKEFKKKKKKKHDGVSVNKEDVPPTSSRKRRSPRQGHTNAEPLGRPSSLKKRTKTKSKGNKKRNVDYDERQISTEPVKSKPTHASRLKAEKRKRTSENAMGRPREQNNSNIVDLVTSSEEEPSATFHLENENLNHKSSDDDTSDNDSSGYSSSAKNSTDGGRFENQRVDDTIAAGVPHFQQCSKKDTGAGSNTGDAIHTIAQSSTQSMAKAAKQDMSLQMSSAGPGKKRKEVERTVEDVRNNQPAQSTTDTYANKKAKKTHPQESRGSLEDRTCRKCNSLFLSMALLLKHQLYCKGATATFGNHHRSDLPLHNHAVRIERFQKASGPVDNRLFDERHNTLQLPSRARQRAAEARELSLPPPRFVKEPNNRPRGPTTTSTSRAEHVPIVKSLPQSPIRRSASNTGLNGTPHPQSLTSELETLRKRVVQALREETAHRCKFCNKWYKDSENVIGACKYHNGEYGFLTEKRVKSGNLKGGIMPPRPYVAWTCCGRRGKDAPPCQTGGVHSRNEK